MQDLQRTTPVYSEHRLDAKKKTREKRGSDCIFVEKASARGASWSPGGCQHCQPGLGSRDPAARSLQVNPPGGA